MTTELHQASESVHDIERSLEKAVQGVRDRQEMGKAIENLNKMREELRQRIGTVDIAVELVRDARNP